MKIALSRHLPEVTLAEVADGVADGRLSPMDRRHLETCDRCRRLVEGHRRATRLLAGDWQMMALGATETVTRNARQVAPMVGVLAVMALLGIALWSRGVVSVGDPRTTPPPPSWQVPSASGAAIDDCNPGAEDGPGWTGPPISPGAASEVQSGLIAGWATAPNSQLVMIANPDRGTMTKVTHTPITHTNYEGGVIAWSPDGGALAVGWAGREPGSGTRPARDCQDLFVASGGAFTRASAVPVDAWRWAWSPDSSRLAATVGFGESDVVVVQQDGPTIALGTPCEGCAVTESLAWSPDGSFLAAPYTIIDPHSALIVEAGVAFTDADRAAWRTQSMDEASLVAVIGWIDDDHLLVNLATGDDQRGELLTVSAADPQDVKTLSIDVPAGHEPMSVQLAPDRSSVLVSPASWDGSQDVVIVDLGTTSRTVIHSAAAVVTTAWSPDSSAVAIVSGIGEPRPGGVDARHELAVFELSTGQQRQVWTGSTDRPGLVWSPDSSQLAISGEPGGPDAGLWVADRDGSDLRLVSDTPLWSMSWQPAWP